MHKVSRSLLLAGVLAFGTLTAACEGDTVVSTPTPTGVTNITVTPAQATIAAGSTIQLATSVTADASTAKTVTWTTSSASVATVDATGKVTGVAAGTATIIATSTADATKAAAAVITVTGTTATQPNTVAISSITTNVGGLNAPVNLANVAGQIDVTLFVSGPAGTLNLIQNCATGPNSGKDVIVAQQTVAGSQNQTPVTLSYNTAGTGTVNASNVAVYSNTATTPVSANGNCTLKAQLGTATATNLTPLTLNNNNVFRATTTFTKTTTLGVQNSISAKDGLRYDQGDLTVTVTPVVYTTVSTGGAVQTPALASITYAGRTVTNIAIANGSFSATFPSSQASSTAAATAAISIYQYTSPSAGDAVIVSGFSDASGQPITVANGVPVSSTTGLLVNNLRSDNGSPCVTSITTGTIPASTCNTSNNGFITVSAAAFAQVLNLTGAPRNYINAAYAFAANSQADLDQAFAASQLTTSFYVGAVPSTGIANLAGGVINPTSSSCSITGLTKVTTGADIAQTTAPFTPGYFVRVIENDPLGNVTCQDFGPFGVDKQNPNALSQTGGPGTNSVVVAADQVSFFSVDSVSGFTPGAELLVRSLRNFSSTNANCVIGTASGNTCAAVASPFNVDPTGAFTTQAYYQVFVNARDQAGNLSPTITNVYLLDTTAPTVAGISIPQTLAGGTSVTFSSTASDNVDLQSSSFDITYSAASGGVSLWYPGDNYGPNYDATVVTSAPLNATVPFFIKQLQGTAGGAPVAFAAGAGADSGRASRITVRAIDAANLISNASFADIPAINITNSNGFTAGTQLSTFNVTTAAVSISNPSGSTAPATTTTSTTLVAQAVLNSATAQQANLPFSQVCFFYQQTAAGNAVNPSIPVGDLVSIGCVSSPDIADVANVSRTWTYRLAGFDPAAALGTAGTLNIYAVGVNSNGVGLLSGANAAITLVP